MVGVTLCGNVGMCDLGIVNSAWDSKSSSVRPAAVCLPQHGLLPSFCGEGERLADWHQGFNCWSIASSDTLNNSIEKTLYQITKILSFH